MSGVKMPGIPLVTVYFFSKKMHVPSFLTKQVGGERRDGRVEEEKEEVERVRRLEGYLWSRIYAYQIPLFTTNQILVFREATQNGPISETYFRDWLLLRPGEPAKVRYRRPPTLASAP